MCPPGGQASVECAIERFGDCTLLTRSSRTADVTEAHWTLDRGTHPLTVGTFLDCVAELGIAAQNLVELRPLFESDDGWRVLHAIIRQMSVPLRKLCLDDGGGLLNKVVVDPSFPPLGGKKGRYRRASISWRTERREMVLGSADGSREAVVVPEAEHEIEVGRLYGIEFAEEGWCAVHSPFDSSVSRTALDEWLASKAVQVNSVGYSVRDVLGIVADYEGAHANEMVAWMAVGVNPENIDRGRNMKYRIINCVRFGCLSYPHILAMYSGLYIIGETRHLLGKAAASGQLAEMHASAVTKAIAPVRTDLTFRARISKATHEMIAVGMSNVPEKRRRQPVYRVWSGSHEWDAAVSRTDI